MLKSNPTPEVAVIGFGGCGYNTLNYFREMNLENLLFVQVEDDEKILRASPAHIKITHNDCQSEEKLSSLLPSGIRLFFLIGGMGGSSCEHMPAVAKILKKSGALGVGLVTNPFAFEERKEKADKDIKALKEELETICLFSNLSYPNKADNLDGMAEFLQGQAQGMWMCVDAMTNKRKDLTKYDVSDLHNMIQGSAN